jgi:hypothetical protein
MAWMKRREPGRNADSIVLRVVLGAAPVLILVIDKFNPPDRLIGAAAIATCVTLLIASYVQYARRSKAGRPTDSN